MDAGLMFRASSYSISGFVDSYFVVDLDKRKSVVGYYFCPSS